MRIPFIIDDIIIALSGSIRTTESKFSPENILDNYFQFRAIQLKSAYTKTSRIVPQWTQRLIPEYDAELQDEKNIIKFKIPKIIELDAFVLGFLYIGSVDCLKQYRLFRSRAEYATYRQHRVQRESKIPVVIYSDEILEIHNTQLSKIDLMLDSVFERPTDLPTYNTESSEFPIDDANHLIVKQLVVESLLGQSNKRPTLKQNNVQQ